MYNFINARELVLVILFIDLDVRRRICQHLHFLAIKLNFVIKRMINPAIPIGRDTYRRNYEKHNQFIKKH
jgi:hypothetical protein